MYIVSAMETEVYEEIALWMENDTPDSRLYFLSGDSLSGKTTICRRLKANSKKFSVDVFYVNLLQMALHQDFIKVLYAGLGLGAQNAPRSMKLAVNMALAFFRDFNRVILIFDACLTMGFQQSSEIQRFAKFVQSCASPDSNVRIIMVDYPDSHVSLLGAEAYGACGRKINQWNDSVGFRKFLRLVFSKHGIVYPNDEDALVSFVLAKTKGSTGGVVNFCSGLKHEAGDSNFIYDKLWR